jgi:CBS domain-containing protein
MRNSILDFKNILKEVHSSGKSVKTTPKQIVSYFNATKRGWRIIDSVNQMMEENLVYSDPDFRNAWFYGAILINPKPKVKTSENVTVVAKDPTPRISLLNAANILNSDSQGSLVGLISVSRDTGLSEATTLMIMHDFSQLPILNGPKTTVGLISWKSIGRALALGKTCNTVNDCKENVVVLAYETPLFEAVQLIRKNEVVLIQQKDRTICGIVTATDVADQFITLSEPFLIIEQIENHIRRLLNNRYTPEELNSFIKIDDGKDIQSLADLSFGQYIMIIEKKDLFERLGLKIDRVVIKEQLELVRKIRNDVMHFDPEGITQDRIEILRKTAQFFYTLSDTLA